MLSLSLLPCRGEGDGTRRAEPQQLGKHHAPPLYFREAPNVPSLSYGKCGTALQRPQPSPWVQEAETSSVQPPLPSCKLHGTSQPLCQVFKIRFCPKRDMEAPHWLLSEQLPSHPPLRAGTPSASHGGQEKYGSWMWGCTADWEAGTSSWRTCQKRPHLLLGSWKINPLWVSSSDVIPSTRVYAGWGWKCEGPLYALSWGGLQGSWGAGGPPAPLQRLQVGG